MGATQTSRNPANQPTDEKYSMKIGDFPIVWNRVFQWRVGVFTLALGLSVPGLVGHVQADWLEISEGEYQLSRQGDRVRLVAHEADLYDVLTELGEATGVSFKVDSGLKGQLVSVDTIGKELEDVARSLAANYQLAYERIGDRLVVKAAHFSAAGEVETTVVGVPRAGTGLEGSEPEALAARQMEASVALDPRTPSDLGLLSNSSRPMRELTSRNGPPSLILSSAVLDTQALKETGQGLVIPERFRAPADSEYQIVQFDGPVSNETRLEIEARGGRIAHYVPKNAYAVHLPPAKRDSVLNMPGVLHVEPYHPYFKMNRDILSFLGGFPDAQAAERAEAGDYVVSLFDGLDSEAVLGDYPVEIIRTHDSLDFQVAEIKADPTVLSQLIAEDGVKWVEAKIGRKVMNDLGEQNVGASLLKRLHPSLDGSGVIVGVTDSGADVTHRGYAIDPDLPTDLNVNSRIVDYHVAPFGAGDGIIGDTNGHGTHVAGSVLGNGGHSSTAASVPGSGIAPYDPLQFAGMAPGAGLVMIEDFGSFSDEEQVELAYDSGARLSNNSWGGVVGFDYNIFSQIWDGLVRDAKQNEPGNQELITFFSAGNSAGGAPDGVTANAGTIGWPGNAKNVITVGAVEQERMADNRPLGNNTLPENDTAWQVASFSGRGPVTDADLRVKPDIVAPGTYVLSMQSQDLPVSWDEFSDPTAFEFDTRNNNVDTGPFYGFLSGTSMASPIATGAGALVYQYLTQTLEMEAPSPALMKAALVAGARNLNSYVYQHPSFGAAPAIVHQGWGNVDVVKTVDGTRIGLTDEVIYLDQGDTSPVDTDEEYIFQIEIGEDDGGLKIVLAWTDVPGDPANAVRLVNNLDLVLVGEDATGHIGNYFVDGLNSADILGIGPGSSLLGDDFNNVEVISSHDLEPGKYTIRVIGANVPQGPQDFALVIMKGQAIEGPNYAVNPHMDLDDEDQPVVVFEQTDDGGFTQVHLTRWKGSVPVDERPIGSWARMEGQWFGESGSLVGTAISQTVDPSNNPSVAVAGDRIYVAWEQQTSDTNFPTSIYFRALEGEDWVELSGSARFQGISMNFEYDALFPVVAVAGDGQPIVAWQQNREVGSWIHAVKWNGSAWVGLGTSDMGVPGSANSARPDMEVDQFGNVVIAWEEATSSKIRVRRWNGAVWEGVGDLGHAPFAQQPDLGIGPGGQIYVAYQQFPDFLSGQQWVQVFVARSTAENTWIGLQGSYQYPGISASTNATMTPIEPSIDINDAGVVVVGWQQTTSNNNAVIVKRADTAGWVGVSGAGVYPGVDEVPGFNLEPTLKVDSLGTPVVNWELIAGATNRPTESLTYTLVRDREAPAFFGLATATGQSGGAVNLGWLEAFDDSEPITYTVYRSTVSYACGTPVTCDPADVFSNPIATTQATSIQVTGLQNGRVYCFAVRATDATGLQDDNQVIRTAGPVAGTGDIDQDCLDNLIEQSIGTGVCIKDTDIDGMWDGWEWTFSTYNPGFLGVYGMDPLDNGFEKINTVQTGDGDPLQLPQEDIDGDGASNLEEFQWWLANAGGNCNVAATSPDPTNPDTDGDGLADGWEIFNNLNPVNPADGDDDNDGDGLSNKDEFENGGDPFNPDSDGDGIDDGDEFDLGTAVSRGDTDRDGLDDGFEVNVLGSDPIHWDSNGSRLSDGDAYQLGFDDPTAVFSNFNFLACWDFETPESQEGWTHRTPNPAFPYDLWHLSTADPEPEQSGDGILEVDERSVITAWRVANDPTTANPDATYNLANLAINTELTSPAVDATETTTLFAEWNEWFDTEQGQDLTRVFALADGDLIPVPISSTVSGRSDGWVHRVADMTEFAGREGVRLVFRFQTLNGTDQNFRGWYVDDVCIYEANTFSGWVRDVDGRPVDEAVVSFIGRGGVTNVVDSHTVVAAGKIFASVDMVEDGSFELRGLPQGQYYLKADSPIHKAEFWNGPLMTGDYAFGAILNPGVFARESVQPQGIVDLTATAAAGEAFFELERGSSRACLGVTADSAYPVTLNGGLATVWNGVNTPAGASLVGYLTESSGTLTNRMPDWLDNPVMPDLLCDLVPGRHLPYAVGTGTLYPLPFVTVREAETTLVGISTEQAVGRLFVEAEDGGAYPILVDGQSTGFTTPANIPITAGAHLVQISLPLGQAKFTPVKEVSVPIGSRARVTFTEENLTGETGEILVQAYDIFGRPITNATIVVDGYPLTADDVPPGADLTTPTTVIGVKPGLHTVQVQLEGYKDVAFRGVNTGAESTAVATFPMFQADRDYDLVGDRVEITGYQDLFLFHRDEDPDFDELTNLEEFSQFAAHGITLNIFTNDTDGDLMLDGQEVAYDGVPVNLGFSTLWTNAPDQAQDVYSRFKGRYLDGLDYFENGHYVASIDCDRFDALSFSQSAPVVPTEEDAASVFGVIPNTDDRLRVSPSHPTIAEIYSDTLPHRVDTDGDGMWDGWEHAFDGTYTSPQGVNAQLDPIECGRTDEDRDGDGLSNLLEFLGRDGIANTNDFLDPTDFDTDDDQMPDGFEMEFGFDPLDPSDALWDADDDGLSNLAEYLVGTSPLEADTDGDFLPDGAEFDFGANPNNIDTDEDGLLDGREVWDRDLDGVFDGGFFNVLPGSDFDNDGLFDGPQDYDSDGDGMPDGFEVLDPSFGLPYGDVPEDCILDPLNASDADLDCDGDGLTNLEEWLVRFSLVGNPPVSFNPIYADFPDALWFYSTNPYIADTDGDEFPDGYEVEFGLNPQDPWPNTADTNRTNGVGTFGPTGDPDGDGLWNMREYQMRFVLDPDADPSAVEALSTYPWDPDSDDDGLWDGEEDRVFRTSPRLQDTDGDLILDGANIPDTMAEVESMVRNEFLQPLSVNNLDGTTNDIWRLDWGNNILSIPFWSRVEVAPGTAPPGRWGASSSYIPINTFDDGSLIDHRSIVWLGGRQGVTKQPDIWQFFLESGSWLQLSSSIWGPDLMFGSYSFFGTLSEMSSVPLFIGRNTATIDDCDNRPGMGDRNYAWIYTNNGWDQLYNYYPTSIQSYFGPTDSVQLLGIEMLAETSVWEAVRSSIANNATNVFPVVLDDLTIAGAVTMPLGLGTLSESTSLDTNANPVVTTTNIDAWVATALHVEIPADFTFSDECIDLMSASLIFDLVTPPEADLEWNFLLEVGLIDGLSPADYTLAGGNNPLVRLDPTVYFNTSVGTNTIPGGIPNGDYAVDITAQLQELLAFPGFAGTNFGVVATSESLESALFLKDSARIELSFKQNWQVGNDEPGREPYWEPIDSIGYDNETTNITSTARKMSPMAHDYGEDVIVMFGGIHGNRILGDTIEVSYSWDNDGSPDATSVTRIEVANGISPPARYAHNLVYDAARTRVILFGGFDVNHRPLNDVWAYTVGNNTWQPITVFMDNQRPMPRGGASMVYFGGRDWNRTAGIWNDQNRIVMFGGTDGDVYFNDTWVLAFDTEGRIETELAPDPASTTRWILAVPNGEHGFGPSPRMFADMVYAQNGVSVASEDGSVDAVAAAYLVGGRTGVLPTGADTDDDKVDDGTEFALGGAAAGRDPRVNALTQQSATETIPYAYKRIGTPNSFGFFERGAIANFEVLSYVDRRGTVNQEYQGHSVDYNEDGQGFTIFSTGVDAWLVQDSHLWYHRFGGEQPADPRDVWELGIPDNSVSGPGAPAYAYRGRWVYGTNLNGNYPNSAIMELYSPVFNLDVPPADTAVPGLETGYYLSFYEWLDLADGNDVVRVDAIRPQNETDLLTRTHTLGTDPPPLVMGNRNNAYNTAGEWRRQVVPLDILGGETNIFLRFTLTSDGANTAGGWYVDDVTIFQAAQISGVLTNEFGEPLIGSRVDLAGTNVNQTVLDTTFTDLQGRYKFGPLPFGNYKVGVGGNLIDVGLTPGDPDQSNDSKFQVIVTHATHTNVGKVSWPAIIGAKYTVEYVDNPVVDPWTPLGTIQAGSVLETFIDVTAPPTYRLYRIILLPD